MYVESWLIGTKIENDKRIVVTKQITFTSRFNDVKNPVIAPGPMTYM